MALNTKFSLYHVRFEERVVFQHLQVAMPADALAQLGAASLAFRQATRPDAIGPREELCIRNEN